MLPLDLVIRNAQIIDGTGAPSFRGDIAVRGDRIVDIGQSLAEGVVDIDADGQVVSPGFIDVHTHYDPQLCWDGMVTPSPEHGITTVIVGNCSLSLAPVTPSSRDKITALFGTVEDLDKAYFDAAVPYAWESFGEYLSFIRPRLGPNVGVLIGHAALRLYVMGADAQTRAATEHEIARMCDLLGTAMQAGGIGLSLTYGHLDECGQELPTHFAAREELLALCSVMACHGRGVVECSPDFRDPATLVDLIDDLGSLALETGVTFSMSPILHAPHLGDAWLRQLVRLESWRAKGAPIYAQTQTRPLDQTIRLSRGSAALSKLTLWSRIMAQPLDERFASLSDPALRDTLGAEIDQMRGLFDALVVKSATHPDNMRFVGRHVREIASTADRPFIDILLDIALRDRMETEFEIKGFVHADPQIVAMLLTHPAMQIGSGDAGAHVGQFSGAGDSSYLLQHFVRELGYVTLEHAVHRLTANLAQSWNIVDRGVIAPGKFADLVVFDPATIARREEEWVVDLPGGGGRYIRHADGIDKVIVNGRLLVDRGVYGKARPGHII